MTSTPVLPTGRHRQLGAEDVIVSKTDLRGHLTYVNDTFVDISGYAEQDLLGKAHNVIRHPDMPRAVFALLWETLQRGEEIFAYVVNLCADGDHYWVLAHVTPTVDAGGRTVGYHSNRRAPAPEAVAQAEAVYRRVLAVEAAQPSARVATAAGTAELQRILAEAGTTYDAWVWSLTHQAGKAVA